MDIDRIDHAGLNVRDLETSARFYQRAFGFTVIHKWRTTWMIGDDVARLGLFQRPSAGPVCNIDNTLAMTHLAFRTTGVGFDRIQAALRERGVEFTPPEDTGIAFSIFVLDPDNHQIEITTYDRDWQLAGGKTP